MKHDVIFVRLQEKTSLLLEAREIGLSKSWASRLHARALENLSRSLRKLQIA